MLAARSSTHPFAAFFPETSRSFDFIVPSPSAVLLPASAASDMPAAGAPATNVTGAAKPLERRMNHPVLQSVDGHLAAFTLRLTRAAHARATTAPRPRHHT